MVLSETSGQDRAIRAAQQALESPLLDNRDIMGARKFYLSIISGDEAELQMDELSMIAGHFKGGQAMSARGDLWS